MSPIMGDARGSGSRLCRDVQRCAESTCLNFLNPCLPIASLASLRVGDRNMSNMNSANERVLNFVFEYRCRSSTRTCCRMMLACLACKLCDYSFFQTVLTMQRPPFPGTACLFSSGTEAGRWSKQRCLCSALDLSKVSLVSLRRHVPAGCDEIEVGCRRLWASMP